MQAPLIAFVAEFLPRATTDVEQAIPTQIASPLFEDPQRGIAVSGQLDPVPEVFRGPLG